MKTNSTLMKAVWITIFFTAGLMLTSKAATFTAVASGNWTSSATWGGTSPAVDVTGADNIIIPLGITVNLNDNVTVDNALATVAVAGGLNGSSDLTITNGAVTLTGSLTANTLTVGANGQLTSSGTITVNNFINNQALLDIASSLTVNNSVTLSAGIVQLSTGGTVSLADHGTVNISGGTMQMNGGSLAVVGSYNLTYSGNASTVGLEAGLTGLTNLIINLNSSSSHISLSGDVAVAGALQLQQGQLDLNGHTLNIKGTVSTTVNAGISGNASGNITINSTGNVGNVSFTTGASTIGNLMVDIGGNGSIDLHSDLEVAGNLDVMNGTINVGSHLLTTDGSLSFSGTGMLGTTTSSDLIISGSGNVGTIVLGGSGAVGNLTIDISSGGSVTAGSAVAVTGTLDLQDGSLMLNGNNLTINGTIDASGSGSIGGSLTSSITIEGTGNVGSLELSSSANTIGDLTINAGSSGSVSLASDVQVAGSLTLTSGHVVLGNYFLTILSSGSISGGSSVGYVEADGNGSLVIQMGGNGADATFPVGTATHFAPVMVTNNSASSGSYMVNLMNGVFASGTTGTDLSATESAVNASWNVETDISANVNADLEVFWNTAMEVNGFDHTHAYLAHYTSGMWDATATAQATAHAGGMYSIKRTGIASFSPFAVFDNNTALGIAEKANDAYRLYPNPAAHYLYVATPELSAGTSYRLFDVAGRLVGKGEISRNDPAIDVSDLKSGAYFISLNNQPSRFFMKE